MVLAAAVMATAAVVVGRQLERLASQPAEHVQLRDELPAIARRRVAARLCGRHVHVLANF